MSDTPRTDIYVLNGSQRSRQDMINFAKKLECELAEDKFFVAAARLKRELAERDAQIVRLRGALEGMVDRFVSVASLEYGRKPDDVAEVVAARAALSGPSE